VPVVGSTQHIAFCLLMKKSIHSYIKRDKSVSGAFLKNLFVLLQIFVNSKIRYSLTIIILDYSTEETHTRYLADIALQFRDRYISFT
jgi:hypothetical protein